MDFSPIYQSVFQLWYLIPIAIIIGLIKTPWFKGLFGEWLVNISAKYRLNKNTYHLFKNVTLSTEDGTTQIDHIIVSVYGIFVIETKNMKGWIFGSEHQAFWTQSIYKHKTKFQNPLRQNYKHVKSLQSLLGLDNGKIHSLVVFVGDSTFKTDMPENVTYAGGYIRYIKSKTQPILSENEVTAIIDKISSGRSTPSFKTNREHVKHVNDIVEQKHDKKSCSKCGAEMVLREAKKGFNKGNQFWGCSNFPRCRNVTSI